MLRSRSLLDSVYERAVEGAEDSTLGVLLHGVLAQPLVAPVGSSDVGDSGLDTAPLTARAEAGAAAADVPGDLIRAELARNVFDAAGVGAIDGPSAATWAEVRRSVLAEVAAERVAGRASRRLVQRRARIAAGIAVASAAAVLLGVILVDDRPIEGPAIVFADVDQPPAIDFTVLRLGPR